MRAMRFALAAMLLATAAQAQAGIILAQNSSLTMTGNADASAGDSIPGSSNTDAQSQGATISPLSASLGAGVIDSLNDASVTTTGSATASWTSDDQGMVHFANHGWTTANVANGRAELFGSAFVYSFVAQTSGTFVVNYTISLDSRSTETFGLNGFHYNFLGATDHFIALYPPGWNDSTSTASFTGSISETITAGNNYVLTIGSYANIVGGLGTRTSIMDGQFDFAARGDNPPPSVVPEPTSLALAGFAGIGMAVGAWRRRRQHAA